MILAHDVIRCRHFRLDPTTPSACALARPCRAGAARWRWSLLAACAGHARRAAGRPVRGLREAAEHRLDMLATGLDADLARFDYLPALLEMTPVVPALLDAPADPQLRDAVNRYLDGVNATAGAEMLYVLDRQRHVGGRIRLGPARHHDRPGPVVPALRQRRAWQQGAAASTASASPAASPATTCRMRCVAAARCAASWPCKVNLEEAERAWRKLPGDVLLIDERGVVILSTRDDWKYRPVRCRSDAPQRAEVLRTAPLRRAPAWSRCAGPERSRWRGDVQLVRLDGRRPARVDAAAARRAVAAGGARRPGAAARAAARYAAPSRASLAMAVLLLVAVTLWQRRRAVRHKLAKPGGAASRARQPRVHRRRAHRRSCAPRRTTWCMPARWRALGQMSAGMVHELNQPLTALRTLVRQRRHPARARARSTTCAATCSASRGMVDRLARLTSRLKTFAHKQRHCRSQPVPLARSIADAQALLGAELKDARHRTSRSTCGRADLSGAWPTRRRIGSVLDQPDAQRHRRDAGVAAPRAARDRREPQTAGSCCEVTRHRSRHPRRHPARACSSLSSPASRPARASAWDS